jgi:hypothetical protein
MMLSDRVRIWNELMKLKVFDFHFYQRSQFDWRVEVGDMYCLTRCGLDLYIISRVSHLTVEGLPTAESVVECKLLVDGDGRSPLPERPLVVFKYPEFMDGGFAINRLVIPQYIWMKSNSDMYPLRVAPLLHAPTTYRTRSGEPLSDEEAKAFDALAAGDSVPQLGTPWPAGPPTGIEYAEKKIGGHAMKIEPIDWTAADPAKKEEEQKPGEQLWLPGQ